MRTLRFAGIAAIALMVLVVYGVSAATADDALCLGLDGHRAVEGAAEHQSTPVPFHEGEGIFSITAHGSCVDVVMAADHGAKRLVPVVPATVALTPLLRIVHSDTAIVRRQDGRPLVPLSGFGSTLLRI